jgi:hypothetical protein
MLTTSISALDEIAFLKAQLTLAQTRLERAESFIFDLRCLTAKEKGRALWTRERDGSGLREAYDDLAGLGSWSMLAVRMIILLVDSLPQSLLQIHVQITNDSLAL